MSLGCDIPPHCLALPGGGSNGIVAERKHIKDNGEKKGDRNNEVLVLVLSGFASLPSACGYEW